MLNKRLLYAVIDTNTWIDEAYRLTMKAPTTPANQHHHENKENNKERDCVEQKVDGEGEHAWVINPSAFLQGLVITEVKIVLPSQVVHELDGLKEHRQPHQARALSLALSLYTYIQKMAKRTRRLLERSLLSACVHEEHVLICP
jgi:hypothetical protein